MALPRWRHLQLNRLLGCRACPLAARSVRCAARLSPARDSPRAIPLDTPVTSTREILSFGSKQLVNSSRSPRVFCPLLGLANRPALTDIVSLNSRVTIHSSRHIHMSQRRSSGRLAAKSAGSASGGEGGTSSDGQEEGEFQPPPVSSRFNYEDPATVAHVINPELASRRYEIALQGSSAVNDSSHPL